MDSTVDRAAQARHRMLSEITPTMVKADLKKVEADYRKRVGDCIRLARKSLDWTHKELGDAIRQATGKEPEAAQLSRWEAGSERPHFDALLAVEALRGPLLIALAGLSDQIDVVTEIRVRRSA